MRRGRDDNATRADHVVKLGGACGSDARSFEPRAVAGGGPGRNPGSGDFRIQTYFIYFVFYFIFELSRSSAHRPRCPEPRNELDELCGGRAQAVCSALFRAHSVIDYRTGTTRDYRLLLPLPPTAWAQIYITPPPSFRKINSHRPLRRSLSPFPSLSSTFFPPFGPIRHSHVQP
jgi:hypothetical protein